MKQGPIFQHEGGSPALGERHACVAQLYQRYAPPLFEYLRRHLSAQSDAEDILAEVFIGALRHDLTRKSSDEQRAWLWTVARNKLNDAYRQAGRRQCVSLDAVGETEALSDEMTPEELALQQEEAASLRKYLQSLTAEQQEVLQLRFMGGLRCTEIAKLLHKRDGTIRSMLSRALNALRQQYER